MADIDALAGARRYAAQTTNVPGMCLNEVWKAYGSHNSIGPHAGQYPTAYTGWLYATQRHTDAFPPVGAPVFFGPSPTRTDRNKNAGDVCICIGYDGAGNAIIRCSDGGGAGRMASMTIGARGRQIARPYLGYTTDFLGYQLVNFGPKGAGTVPTSNTISPTYIAAQLGDAYVKEWQRQLGVTQDGAFGPGSTKALQAHLGITADGVFGHGTIKATQAWAGVATDGLWGAATTLGIKHKIDAGRVVTPPVTPPPTWVPPTKTQYDVLVTQAQQLSTANTALQSQLSTANVAAATAQAKVDAVKKVVN